MRKHVHGFLLAVRGALLLSVTAFASDYTITVALDEATSSDLEIVTTTLSATAPGASVSKSLRKLAMGVSGEVDLLLHDCLEDSMLLTRDDGSTIGLQPTDTVRVRFAHRPNVEVSFGNCSFDGRRERCRISQIAVCDDGGSIRRLLSFVGGPPEKICGQVACK
jgi:hypothetical protein